MLLYPFLFPLLFWFQVHGPLILLTLVNVQVLNQIVYELPAEHPLADTRPLRELLGHTPLQVFFKCFYLVPFNFSPLCI